MSKLAQLKKKRGNSLKTLQEKLEQQNTSYQKDERIWKPKFNKDKGKGKCVVRFLPANDGDPFVELMTYSFNGPGGNFYGNARQTIGEDDPVQIASINMFKKAKHEEDKDLKNKALKFLPKRNYYANVYIVKDEEEPDNEGKVFIYQFGPAIYKKLKEKIQPEFDDEEPMDPFDLWDGADFIIRMVANEIPDSKTGKKIVVPNYDKSEFESPSEFMDGDEEKLEEIVDKTYDLSEFIDPAKFDSFEKAAERFKTVTGKPYNWLSEGGVQEHIDEKEEESTLNEEQDNDDGSDDHREQEKETGSIDYNDSPQDDEEDPVERFKRLARGE